MPLVGNKHFAYTKEGMRKAVAHAKKTGQKVKVDKKGLGGMLKKYQQGGMLKGPSHKKGGIPAVVKGGQPIEMEGGEYVIKKDAAKKLGPDILNYINKNGALPKMKNGGEVYKKTGKGSKLEKKVVETIAKGFQKFEKIMGIDPSNTDRQDLGVMGGAMTTGALAAPLGPLAAIPAIVGGARLGKRLMTKRKNKEEKKYAEGGSVNPYLKDFRESETAMTNRLAELAQPGSEEYEKLKRERFQKTGQYGNTGQSRWRAHTRDRSLAIKGARDAAKKAQARSAQSMGLGGQSGMSMFGGLKARAHQKQAGKIIEEERKSRADADRAKQQAEYDAKVDAWKEGKASRYTTPYHQMKEFGSFTYRPNMDYYARGGMVNNSSLFSLLKKLGR